MSESTEHEKTGWVFCGGSIKEGIVDRIPEDAYLVAADRGLVFLEQHGIVPDLIVGDFDSSPEGFIDEYKAKHPDVEVRAYHPVKDYTDSEIGVKAAVEKGCRSIVMAGATGTRLDHVLGNIQVLALLMKEGIEGEIIDSHNRISIHDRSFSIKRKEQWGRYVSFFAYGGDVRGLDLQGFQYTVTDFTLTSIGSRAVSNEISGDAGQVTFSSGTLLMIESDDRAVY